MIDLKELVQSIQMAVVEAADQVRLKNISILDSYFVPAKRPEDVDAADQTLPDVPLVPRMIRLDFPMVTEKGPGVHTVEVPLISIAPPEGLYLKEFRVRMKVEFGLDADDAPKITVAPARNLAGAGPGRSSLAGEGAGTDYKEFADIEIVIAHGDKPEGLTLILDGYARALRAEIPG